MDFSFVEKQRVLLCIVWGEKKSIPKKKIASAKPP